tara:strand:- start:120 stop:425 length:306 start_codon:yes stop_codon:yes gene_type:complete
MSNNINTPNGKRLEKLTNNYKNIDKSVQLGEEKLKKYRKELEEKKLIVKMLENKLEDLKREKNEKWKVLKNAYKGYKEKKYGKNYNNNNNNKLITPKKLKF